MTFYDIILQGDDATEENARDLILCEYILQEAELQGEQDIPHIRYIDTVNGVDIWYNYGADYYCFSPAE